MSRSGLGELLLYKHSLSSVSDTSLQHDKRDNKLKSPQRSATNVCLAADAEGLPGFDEALLHAPGHLSDCIGDFVSRRVGKTHIQETSAKQQFMKPRTVPKTSLYQVNLCRKRKWMTHLLWDLVVSTALAISCWRSRGSMFRSPSTRMHTPCFSRFSLNEEEGGRESSRMAEMKSLNDKNKTVSPFFRKPAFCRRLSLKSCTKSNLAVSCVVQKWVIAAFFTGTGVAHVDSVAWAQQCFQLERVNANDPYFEM